MCNIKDKKDKFSNVLYNLVDKLIPLFSKYDYFDLCRAVFALNSFRSNRSELNFYLTLNETLRLCNKDGEIKIETYNQFCSFYKDIKNFYKFNCYVDRTVSDFGDVYIYFEEKLYPILLGTGYNNMYALMETLYPAMIFCNEINKMKSVLQYFENMIKHLKKYNILDEENCFGDFYIPPKEYFYAVVNYYKTLDTVPDLIRNFDLEIDRCHFINFNNLYYPLFNSSIIFDAYNKAVEKIENEDYSCFSSFIMNNIVINIFAQDENNNKVYTNVSIIEDFEKKIILDNQRCSTLMLGKEGVLLLISEAEYKGESFKLYVDKINDFYNKDQLKFRVNKCGKYGIISVNKSAKFTIATYDFSYFINKKIDLHKHSENIYNQSFLDLIYFISNANTIDEIIDFLIYIDKKKNFLQVFEGYSGVFSMWQNLNRNIEQGAVIYDSLYLDISTADEVQFEKFLRLKDYYPLEWINDTFLYPPSWRIEGAENGYMHISNKSFEGYFGFLRTINQHTLFYSENLFLYDFKNPQVELNNQRFISDVILKYFQIYEMQLINIGLFNYNVETLYLQYDYAKKVDVTGFTTTDNKYVYSDSLQPNDYTILIKFVVNIERFMKDLKHTQTRDIECEFLKEFFSCLEKIGLDTSSLNRQLDLDKKELKNFNSNEIKIKYYFSFDNIKSWPNIDMFVKVRKEIAKICYNNQVTPGVYTKEETKKIVRQIQPALISYFENIISQYDKVKLHCILLSYLAYYTHQKRIEFIRYDFSNDPTLSEDARNINSNIIIANREKYKSYIKDLLYLLETNLYIEHITNTIEIDNENLEFLIAFSTWLVTLQDVSDMAHWKIGDSNVEITSDYVLNTLMTDEDESKQNNKLQRIYDNVDYIPELTNKKFYQDNIIKQLYDDTSFEFSSIIGFVYSLSVLISVDFLKYEIFPDVIKIHINEFEELYYSLFNEEFDRNNIDDMLKTLDFFICDINRLKNIGDIVHNILPIWEREKRNNRFDVRPIVKINNELIFSPVILYDWLKTFESSLFSMYPMYELGLEKTCNAIKQYKEACEKQMEQEIANLFDGKSYIVLKGFDFYKTISKKFPQELGDYDVIAIDIKKKIIWNLESKFINKVGSVYEYANQQKGFFLQNKYDEKFQRRINFLTNNYKILLNFKNVHINDFIIKSYMVTNKVLECDVKQISFEIITFNELNNIINN